MASTQALYDELLDSWRKAVLLGSVQSQLGWDEQTYLPPGGAAHRADQMSLLAGMVHQQLTAPRLGELISATETGDKPAGSNGVFEANVREARRRYDRLTKLPTRLVEELTRVTSLAQQNWVEARKKSNFETFRPWLEKIVALKREEAAALGGGGSNGVPYDALLDDYEPGAKTADVAKIFAALREALVPLVQAIAELEEAAGRLDPDPTIPQGRPGRICHERGGRDRVQLSGRAARRIAPSVLQRHGSGRLPPDHALRRASLSRRVLRRAARSGTRTL